MKIVEPSYEIMDRIDSYEILRKLELIARKCYQSEGLITNDGVSAMNLIKKIIERDHLAMIEHHSISVCFIVDRGVSHELVRHRIASFAQESTRYCKYKDDVTFVKNNFLMPYSLAGMETLKYKEWKKAMQDAENHYLDMLKHGCSAQEARSVLPNSTKTEIVMTCNLREWRAFFKLRTSKAAHPQMREVTVPLLKEFKRKLPIIFDDIEVDE